MVVFPETTKFYTTWQHTLESRGVQVKHSFFLPDLISPFKPIQIRLNTEVASILSRKKGNVKVAWRSRRPRPDYHNPAGADQDLPETIEEFDEIVLCVLADTAKGLLGKTARWIDRFVLGSTKWSDDVTVTHNVRYLASILKIHHLICKDRTLTTCASGIRPNSTSLWL
jgi:hypothetical protein